MKINKNKFYLVVSVNSDGWYGDSMSIVSGKEISYWLKDSLRENDYIYELGDKYICKESKKKYLELCKNV